MHDLVVIGGGINGAAIARDAAYRGMKVILLEKNDFGSGASTKTSKLAHGGVRYLENWQLSLVKESLKERALLLKNAPHLVHPLPFILPVYKGDRYPLWQVNLGLYLYDFMSKKEELPSHSKLSRLEIQNKFSELRTESMQGGCLYYDALMQDNRLLIENIIDAREAGAEVISYAQVDGFLKTNGLINGVSYRLRDEKLPQTIEAKVVVNASGAWSNNIEKWVDDKGKALVTPTKGVHVIVPLIEHETALLLTSPQDGRVFFIIPWNGYSLVGTTDTFYEGNPDDVKVLPQDKAYLLQALNHYFPQMEYTEKTIISSYAGLRPLVATDDKTPAWKIARGTNIDSQQGLISVTGGKYTTHRQVAEDVVDLVDKKLAQPSKFKPCFTANILLPGARQLPQAKKLLAEAGLDQVLQKHLIAQYGSLSLRILEIMQTHKEASKRVCEGHAHIVAEIIYAIRFEAAKNLDDWFCRRTSIAYLPCQGIECVEMTANIFALELGWDQNHMHTNVQQYLSNVTQQTE